MIRVELDPRTGAYLSTAREREPIPDVFALILGDAIHKLRASLYLMIAELVPGRQTNDYVAFSFARAQAALKSAINGRQIPSAGTDVVEKVRALQPYEGENDQLYALHALDIRDKHCLLVPVASAAAMPDATIMRDNAVLASWLSNTTLVRDGTVCLRTPPAEGVYPGQEIPTTCDIVFGDLGLHLDHGPVVYILDSLAMIVEDIINDFAMLPPRAPPNSRARSRPRRAAGGVRSGSGQSPAP